jgi:hypothetical protein
MLNEESRPIEYKEGVVQTQSKDSRVRKKEKEMIQRRGKRREEKGR